ncbi:hypothetical protein Sste5346_001116 [Sporothrix stenoceras]|uniref:Uncharacterized protein n=1 Tax=Sporothrix stenoceras TaxID=5173 RepID=A0ABR3ZT64_9PEZI
MDYYCSSPPSYSQGMNKYWIPHKDIHKKVIMTHIQFYLGADATVRSYTKDGEDGFLITTPGECLTDEQIDDLCIKSMEMWERQAAARATDGTSSSSSTSPKAPLKRPLHQPVVIARAGGRRSSSHSHRSSSSSSSSTHHHHHSRHNHSHSYSRQQYSQYPQQQQQRQLPRLQQSPQHRGPQQQPHPQQHQQQQLYAQPHNYLPPSRSPSSQSQRAVHPYHTGWESLSPAHDSAVPEVERLY